MKENENSHQPTFEGTWRALKGWNTRRRNIIADQTIKQEEQTWKEYLNPQSLTFEEEALRDCIRKIIWIKNNGILVEIDPNKPDIRTYLVYQNNNSFKYDIDTTLPPSVIRIENTTEIEIENEEDYKYFDLFKKDVKLCL